MTIVHSCIAVYLMHTLQCSTVATKSRCNATNFRWSVGVLSTVVDECGCKFVQAYCAIAYTALLAPQQCIVPMGLPNSGIQEIGSNTNAYQPNSYNQLQPQIAVAGSKTALQ